MKFVSAAALGCALAVTVPVVAAKYTPPLVLAKEERIALQAAEAALTARNYAAAAPAITTAIAQASTRYTRYLATSMQLRLGIETGNRQLQAQAIEGMLSSGAAPAANLPQLYKNQGALALSAGDLAKAEASFEKWAELAPDDLEAHLALAELKDDRGNIADSVARIQRAIAIRQAAGQTVPESWYRRGLKQSFDAGLAQPSLQFAQGLVAAYPTAENWRDALLIYRDVYRPDVSAQLDTLRLMRSARALSGERDYLELVEALSADANAGERKAVLDEGVAVKMVDPAKPAFKTLISATGKKATAERKTLAALKKKAEAGTTGEAALAAADAHFGFGEYAEAAELYRMAIQKGTVDPNVANTRLGIALALAGRAPEAETALKAVTGPRSTLASYWLVWLGQRGRPA